MEAGLELIGGEATSEDEVTDGVHWNGLGIVVGGGGGSGEVTDQCVDASDRISLDPTAIKDGKNWVKYLERDLSR